MTTYRFTLSVGASRLRVRVKDTEGREIDGIYTTGNDISLVTGSDYVTLEIFTERVKLRDVNTNLIREGSNFTLNGGGEYIIEGFFKSAPRYPRNYVQPCNRSFNPFSSGSSSCGRNTPSCGDNCPDALLVEMINNVVRNNIPNVTRLISQYSCRSSLKKDVEIQCLSLTSSVLKVTVKEFKHDLLSYILQRISVTNEEVKELLEMVEKINNDRLSPSLQCAKRQTIRVLKMLG